MSFLLQQLACSWSFLSFDLVLVQFNAKFIICTHYFYLSNSQSVELYCESGKVGSYTFHTYFVLIIFTTLPLPRVHRPNLLTLEPNCEPGIVDPYILVRLSLFEILSRSEVP